MIDKYNLLNKTLLFNIWIFILFQIFYVLRNILHNYFDIKLFNLYYGTAQSIHINITSAIKLHSNTYNGSQNSI